MLLSRCKNFLFLILFALVLISFPGYNVVECAKKSGGGGSPSAAPVHEPIIEEVTAKQLERILGEKEYVAVYWCKFWWMYHQKEDYALTLFLLVLQLYSFDHAIQWKIRYYLICFKFVKWNILWYWNFLSFKSAIEFLLLLLLVICAFLLAIKLFYNT